MTDRRQNGWGPIIPKRDSSKSKVGRAPSNLQGLVLSAQVDVLGLALRQRASVAGCQLCSLPRLAGRRQLANLDQCQCHRRCSTRQALGNSDRHSAAFAIALGTPGGLTHSSVVMLSCSHRRLELCDVAQIPSEKHQGNARFSLLVNVDSGIPCGPDAERPFRNSCGRTLLYHSKMPRHRAFVTCFAVSEWGFMCGCQGLVWTALPLDRLKFRFFLSRCFLVEFWWCF